jgi:pyruvate/2-oxoglutarate/acetoin dehydrogenase E1 component
MEADPGVIVFGIGVDDHKAIYGTTAGLLDRFGPERVFDTPLSEEGMTGFAVGAAMAGLRPIHVHIRMDFVMLAMNQIVNFAAKARYMYGGAVSVPMVVRSIIGRSWGQGPQHAQALHALFMHIPGLLVVAPTTPYDAKGCLITSIRDDNPVMFVEHRLLHRQHGEVPEQPYEAPLGKARVLTHGRDVTIVGISHMAVECVRACHALKTIGIEAQVIDPVWLAPLDMDTIVESARRTGHVLIVDNAWTTCGASAEILAQVVELTGPGIQVQRMGFAPVTCPTTPSLEELFYPSARSIAEAAARMLSRWRQDWVPPVEASTEILEFRGPF